MAQQSYRQHERAAERYMFVQDESCSEESPDDESCSEDERSEDEGEDVTTGRHGHYVSSRAANQSTYYYRQQYGSWIHSSKAYQVHASLQPKHGNCEENFYQACSSENPISDVKAQVTIFNLEKEYVIHENYQEKDKGEDDSSSSHKMKGSFEKNLESGNHMDNFAISKENIAKAHDNSNVEVEGFNENSHAESYESCLQRDHLMVDLSGSYKDHDSFMKILETRNDKNCSIKEKGQEL